ncbi:hypothetical protein F5Y14DRAFT_398054 [Nemania sp. NC0429]|nr:hypothetical protein F5Y14DRAFT_398054 [Nemania sp. NC0429]
MAPGSFHQFTSLPYEIRSMIYLFATPLRIVHIQEDHEDREEFEERFRTKPVQLKLHPSISYFARNWRERIPWAPASWRQYYRHHQPTLEAYGFDCPRPKHQPWEPTEEVPAIPHHFLSENPNVAWEFTRTGSFYSTAPIPSLLHTTRESRETLIASGFELAFRTRTCGPRTWFNFKTDILYIKHVSEYDEEYAEEYGGEHYESARRGPVRSLLSGNKNWDIGQFEPEDLQRVKRLALGSSAEVVSYDSEKGVYEVSDSLALFTGVEELFLEEPSLRFDATGGTYKPTEDSYLWCYSPAVEADVLAAIFLQRYTVESTGYRHVGLKFYKEENMGDGSRFFIDTARTFERKLASLRDVLVRRDSVVPWKIPEISIVYIASAAKCRSLFEWRWDAWNRFQTIKESQARSEAVEEARRSIDIPLRPLYDIEGRPPSPFSEQFRDDEEVYRELRDIVEYEEYDERYQTNEQRSWILGGTVAAPEVGVAI